ncbi:hypothetical protein MRX96_032456 [Rhipicephalus microplus]
MVPALRACEPLESCDWRNGLQNELFALTVRYLVHSSLRNAALVLLAQKKIPRAWTLGRSFGCSCAMSEYCSYCRNDWKTCPYCRRTRPARRDASTQVEMGPEGNYSAVDNNAGKAKLCDN